MKQKTNGTTVCLLDDDPSFPQGNEPDAFKRRLPGATV
jgi:hypothetical protein